MPVLADEDIVAPAALPIHADGDAVRLEQAGEVGARKLRALIRVEDFRAAVVRDRLLDGLEAKRGIPRDRHPPAPLDDTRKREEPTGSSRFRSRTCIPSGVYLPPAFRWKVTVAAPYVATIWHCPSA
jgi:hypothetical protein